jgi:hypothetical protein
MVKVAGRRGLSAFPVGDEQRLPRLTESRLGI